MTAADPDIIETGEFTSAGHRNWAHPKAMELWQAACEAEREVTRRTGKTAMERACDEIDSAGRRIRIVLIKNAARLYCRRPGYLDAIKLGLSDAHPAFILAFVEREARGTAWGRIDMLGVLPVNLAGAAIYARWLRREMRREFVAADRARVWAAIQRRLPEHLCETEETV